MLTGDIAEFPLGALLQSLAGPGKSGVLRIGVGDQEGLVYLNASKVVHAELGNVVGPRALTILAGVRRAPFTFEESATPPSEITIETGIQTVLTRLLMEMSEWDNLEVLIRTDWSNVLTRGLRLPPAGDTEMATMLNEAEGRTVISILLDNQPLVIGERLNRALREGWLRRQGSSVAEWILLDVSASHSQDGGIVYIDQSLYQLWASELKKPFSIRIRPCRTPDNLTNSGLGRLFSRRSNVSGKAVLGVRPAEGILGQIMLSMRDLKKYSLNPGDHVEVIPIVL